MKIIFATGNEDKLKEIRKIFAGILPVYSMKEAGFHPDIEEDGETFTENALIKARSLGVLEDAIVMADDSGLSVFALNGEPGIYSARYMEGYDYPDKCRNIIERLEGVEGDRRKAFFVCAIAAVFPDGTEETTEGVFEGRIGYELKGENGFGYDPIFVTASGKTSAEISEEEKNKISHRGQALDKMRPIVLAWLKKHQEEK